ncbi:MAG: GNAT family N-acetyltransferase [Oscillospiraceae bacterium]
MTLETERLVLRPITHADAEDIFEYAQNENVGPNAGWKPHGSIEETHEIIDTVFSTENVFGIILRDTGKLIGSVGIIDDQKRENDEARMLGYSIGEAYWGQGYMTEAARALITYGFDELKLALISAYCYPHNTRSKSVLKKLGFQYEGTLALGEKLYTGEILAHDCFALLAKDRT